MGNVTDKASRKPRAGAPTTHPVTAGADPGSGRWRRLSAARRRVQDLSGRPMTSWHLILAVFGLLLAVGLMMVLASSSAAAWQSKSRDSFSTFENQTVFAGIGLVGFFVAMRVSVRQIRRWSFPAVAVSILLLAVVLVPGLGARYNGARSWIDFGSVSLQPSEPAKLALLLWMAHVLASRRNALGSARSLLLPVLPVFLWMCVLLMMEPALGTTITLSIVFFAVLYFAGAPWWMFAGVGAAAVAAGTYLATSAGYRSARISAFLDPQAHPELTYQLHQGFYAMGHGGWFGVGLGQSTAKYGWLPNASSDFIFAIIGEELGLVGAALVLLLFAVLAYTGLRIARRNVDPFIKITAAASTIWLVGQAAINMGYVVGLLPVTGIPLPMISTGGTSLIITMMVFGLLANFALREPQAAAARLNTPSRVATFLGLRSSAERPARRRRRDRRGPVRGARRNDPLQGGPPRPGQRPLRPAGVGRSPNANPARSGRARSGPAPQPPTGLGSAASFPRRLPGTPAVIASVHPPIQPGPLQRPHPGATPTLTPPSTPATMSANG